MAENTFVKEKALADLSKEVSEKDIALTLHFDTKLLEQRMIVEREEEKEGRQVRRRRRGRRGRGRRGILAAIRVKGLHFHLLNQLLAKVSKSTGQIGPSANVAYTYGVV